MPDNKASRAILTSWTLLNAGIRLRAGEGVTLVLDSRLAGAGDNGVESCEAAIAERAVDDLSEPSWEGHEGGEFEDGAEAHMRVRAPGKRTVRFFVERKIGEEWQPFAEATARAEGGVARATVLVQHPDSERAPAAIAAAELRFHCELA